MSTNAPSSTLISRSDFRRRLGYYLTGIAIGCVMAGLLISARARLAQQQPTTDQSQQGGGTGGSQPGALPAR